MNTTNNTVIQWLLEDNNPAVKYRTQTEILGEKADMSPVKEWILSKLPTNFHETNGLWYVYYITALAECGLKFTDLDSVYFDKAFARIKANFEYGCEDFMLLTALVKLGFNENKSIKNIVSGLSKHNLPDGGYLCFQKLNKLNYTPKSCYKANLHALMLVAELEKNEIKIDFEENIANYFLNRNLFYRTDDSNALVINSREGWRNIDVFYPFEVMRVGLQNIIYAFSALGYCNDERLNNALEMLNAQKDGDGKIILKGTLSKSYLPKEKAGKPSKWATFYALLAEKEKNHA